MCFIYPPHVQTVAAVLQTLAAVILVPAVPGWPRGEQDMLGTGYWLVTAITPPPSPLKGSLHYSLAFHTLQCNIFGLGTNSTEWTCVEHQANSTKDFFEVSSEIKCKIPMWVTVFMPLPYFFFLSVFFKYLYQQQKELDRFLRRGHCVLEISNHFITKTAHILC